MTTTNPGYSGYRRSRGFGVGNLGTRETIICGVALMGVAFSPMLGSLALTGVLAIGAVFVVAFAVLPIVGGRTVLSAMAFHGRFHGAGNAAAYVDDTLEEFPRGEHLPGAAAPLCPIVVEDGRGGTQALVWNRQTGLLSAPLLVAPVGLTLADDTDALQWVTNFGGMLAELGHMPLVDSIAFVTETAPAGGMNQRAYTLDRLDKNDAAPEFCTRVLGRLVNQSRARTAEVTCLVVINFDLTKATPVPDTLQRGAAEVVNMLPRFESSLAACGMTVMARMTRAGLIRYLRAAYDPDVRTREIPDSEVLWDWKDARPLRTEGTRADVYAHDSGYSVSWVFTAPPNGVVRYRSLLPLVSPGKYHRRLCMVYRPYSASEAAKKVESEVNAGVFRRIWAQKTKKDETQREHDDRVKARRAAQQESLGAGLGRFTFYLTTTVRNETTLPAACADAEERQGQSKGRWRRARKAMEATFVASLGLGVDPASGLSRNAADRWGN